MNEEILYKVFEVPLSDKNYRDKIKSIIREYLNKCDITDKKMLVNIITDETKGTQQPKFIDYIVNKYLMSKENSK